MSPRYVLPGGYPNPDPHYISPEEEAAMYDGPPDWDGDAIPEADAESPVSASKASHLESNPES